jgi:hypothetical protein
LTSGFTIIILDTKNDSPHKTNMKRNQTMKKILVLTAALMLFVSSLAFAGGDQNCGGDGEGDVGRSSPGTATQSREALD